MLHSIATVSLSGGLQEKLYAIAAAKFDLVEIFENELAYFDGSPAELRELIGQLGLGVSLFQPFFDFEAVPDDVFAKNLERATRKFDLMVEIGAPMMLVSSNASTHAIPDDARAAAQLRAMAEKAAEFGLRLGYEAVAWGAHVRSYHDAWRIVQLADHSALGLILDSFHTLAVGDDPEGFAAIPAEKLFHLQLSDAPKMDMDVRSVGRHFRCLPGQGSLDLAGFTRAALTAGYRGPLSIEVFNDELRAAPNRQSAIEAKRSLTFVEEGVRQMGAPAEVVLADPPPPPVLSGLAFIEFAVDGATGLSLAEWLITLGFQKIGRHRSKDVEMYCQGDALIVLNAGADSFAHYYHHLHGPSVCAVGLVVADRQGLLDRAAAYGYKRHSEQTGPGEYSMPSVRAPDGSLTAVVDAAYDPMLDFEPQAQRPNGGAGIVGFDHVARTVPPAQFDSWVSYYRLLLGLHPEPVLELPEPHGLVRSMALSDTPQTVRFVLSFSDSARTVVARSLTTFAGAGVNQIAFSTDDIFSTVASLKTLGARLLQIPASYYVELAIETDLPPALIEQLRSWNILFADDGEGGQFFHAYTETFQDRVFFEVVQRRGGYRRYGEVNAPVRMAAQGKRRPLA